MACVERESVRLRGLESLVRRAWQGNGVGIAGQSRQPLRSRWLTVSSVVSIRRQSWCWLRWRWLTVLGW